MGGVGTVEHGLRSLRDADAATTVPAASQPALRLFKVGLASALQPSADVDGTWSLCTPETAAGFSAVAYYFGRDVAASIDVPVGIIQSTWSGTSAELWTEGGALAEEPDLRSILDEWNAAPAEDHELARRPAPFRLEIDDAELVRADGSAATLSAFDDMRARTSMGGYWTLSAPENATFELATSGTGAYARVEGALRAGTSVSLDATFGRDGKAVDLSPYVALRFRARGAGYFQVRFKEPSITDWDDYVSPGFSASEEWRTISIPLADLRQAGWGVPMAFTQGALSGFSVDAMRTLEGDPPMPPSSLFDAMIAPLTRFPIRGALWYQGEGNTGQAKQYRTLLPALIRGWRRAWVEGDFPFGVVQLPGHGDLPSESGDSWWASLREAQLMTSERVPNVGLAVTIDLGDRVNVHPARKRLVGERLARWALATTYGKSVAFHGPRFIGASIEGSMMRLRFEDDGVGLAASDGAALRGFYVAGADRRFHAAEARVERNTIVVSSTDVASPESVRYDWAGFPDGNLASTDGLPASPFRSDSW